MNSMHIFVHQDKHGIKPRRSAHTLETIDFHWLSAYDVDVGSFGRLERWGGMEEMSARPDIKLETRGEPSVSIWVLPCKEVVERVMKLVRAVGSSQPAESRARNRGGLRQHTLRHWMEDWMLIMWIIGTTGVTGMWLFNLPATAYLPLSSVHKVLEPDSQLYSHTRVAQLFWILFLFLFLIPLVPFVSAISFPVFCWETSLWKLAT
ncbi:hypothetical protein FRC10_004636 [Ceratobasidium sp. 414]|nr:hypothetical protein FRC10_004636 [Ceratobasidium sp. 414]